MLYYVFYRRCPGSNYPAASPESGFGAEPLVSLSYHEPMRVCVEGLMLL